MRRFGALLSVWVAVAMLSSRGMAQTAGKDTKETGVDGHVRRATVIVETEIKGYPQIDPKDPTRKERSTGTFSSCGTGVFINRNGLVITNNHVVDPNHHKEPNERIAIASHTSTPKYSVTVGTKVYTAKLKHQVESGDLAILQLDEVNGQLPATPDYLTFVPDGTLAEGIKIRAVGYPGPKVKEKRLIVTEGLVTKLVRADSGAIGYVETDAAVRPGNSGGPIVNMAGQIVGIATYLDVEQGRSNRSGAVPAHMIKQFLHSAFVEDRIPKTADVMPFIDLFIDQNGILDVPGRERDAQQTTIHWRDGNTTRGALASGKLTMATALGRLDVPLSQAAYLIVNDGTATLLLDGGDRFTCPAKDLKADLRADSGTKPLAMADVTAVAFPHKVQVVPSLQGNGVVLEADQNRVGLTKVDGQVSIANPQRGTLRVPLADISNVESAEAAQKTVRTTKGEQMTGTIEDKSFGAVTSWSAGKPVAFTLSGVRNARITPVDWATVNADGRRLVDRLTLKEADLKQAAGLLDGPDWRKALPILNAAAADSKRSSDSVKCVRLLKAVELLREGKAPDALEAMKKFSRDPKDEVDWLAMSYGTLLEKYKDGRYLGGSLSDPDVLWRASTAAAHEIVTESCTELERMAKQDDDKRKLEALRAMERKLDVADRMEIGSAQYALIRVLQQAYLSRVHFLMNLKEDFEAAYRSSQTKRVPAAALRQKASVVDREFEQGRKEIARIAKRLSTDMVRFVVEPPKMDSAGAKE